MDDEATNSKSKRVPSQNTERDTHSKSERLINFLTSRTICVQILSSRRVAERRSWRWRIEVAPELSDKAAAGNCGTSTRRGRRKFPRGRAKSRADVPRSRLTNCPLRRAREMAACPSKLAQGYFRAFVSPAALTCQRLTPRESAPPDLNQDLRPASSPRLPRNVECRAVRKKSGLFII